MKTIRKGSRDVDSVVMLQELLNRAGVPVPVDGVFGTGTDQAVRDYQAASGLVVDGVAGEQTWIRLLSQSPGYLTDRAEKFLSEADLARAARDLDVELAAIKAVTEVEAAGHGFVGGKTRILFEGHVFWKRLKARGLDPAGLRAGNEDVLYPKWTKAHYLGGVREHDRLNKARLLHEDAALESASWGLFQIMGYQWQSLGYADVRRYTALMAVNEGHQLQAFTRFVEVNDLTKYLKNRQWASFALRYNGPGYKENRYDEKLERAYRRHAA